MAQAFVKKTLSGLLAPADEAAEEVFRKFKAGQVVRADIVKPRSGPHHRLIFALLDVTYKNLPERYAALWSNPRSFRRGLAEAIGHVEEYTTIDGEIKERPLSFSYEELPDEMEFSAKAALAMAVCSTILGTDEPELSAEVSRYADFTGMAA